MKVFVLFTYFVISLFRPWLLYPAGERQVNSPVPESSTYEGSPDDPLDAGDSPLFFPICSAGIGGTIDVSIHGCDDKFVHGQIVYSPIHSETMALCLRLLLMGNGEILRLFVPVTGSFRLFHRTLSDTVPFFGGGIGSILAHDPEFFLFLHYGVDIFIRSRFFINLGKNLLFVGDNYMDFEVFLSTGICF